MTAQLRRFLTVFTLSLLLSRGARAKSTLCEMCHKPIVPARAVCLLDRATGTKHRYRCVHCALVAMHSQFPRSQTTAPSGLTGRPIRIERLQSRWRSAPRSAVFLILKEKEGECLDRHQAFSSVQEYQRYLSKHPHLQALRPGLYRLDQIRKMIQAGMPSR